MEPSAIGIYEQRSYVGMGHSAVSITDEQGFSVILGATQLVTPRTGENHATSAASLVLLDKDKNVIWKAP
jgi:hypothetical protein